MYKHIEKDKRKLTDEEIIHDLEEFAKDTEYGAIYKNALDLIHRLKEGRKTFFKLAKQRYEEKRELEKKVEGLRKAKVIHETVDYCYEDLKKAQTEIERLRKLCVNYRIDCDNIAMEKAELQKQVDELISMGDYGTGYEDGKEEGYQLGKKFSVEQAVKDTAKEIFTDLLKEFSIRKSCGNADIVVKEVAQRYGVRISYF